MKRLLLFVLVLVLLGLVTYMMGVWPWTRLLSDDQWPTAIVTDTVPVVAPDTESEPPRVDVLSGDTVVIDTAPSEDDYADEFDAEGKFDPKKFQDDDIDEVMDILRTLAK